MKKSYWLSAFHLWKKASPFMSAASMNLLTITGSFRLRRCGAPLYLQRANRKTRLPFFLPQSNAIITTVPATGKEKNKVTLLSSAVQRHHHHCTCNRQIGKQGHPSFFRSPVPSYRTAHHILHSKVYRVPQGCRRLFRWSRTSI